MCKIIMLRIMASLSFNKIELMKELLNQPEILSNKFRMKLKIISMLMINKSNLQLCSKIKDPLNQRKILSNKFKMRLRIISMLMINKNILKKFNLQGTINNIIKIQDQSNQQKILKNRLDNRLWSKIMILTLQNSMRILIEMIKSMMSTIRETYLLFKRKDSTMQPFNLKRDL